MLPTLALMGLILGTLLYALLVRRRGAERLGGLLMAKALAASNDVAVARIREATERRRAEMQGVGDRREVVIPDRRTGMDRRGRHDRRRGRGRRTGADRRRGSRAA
jgi:hypothetical protein